MPVHRLIVFLLIIHCQSATGQGSSKDRLQYGAKLGFSMHTMTGGLTKVPVSGSFLAGVWLRVKLSERWTGQPELIFNEKGGGNIDHDDIRFGQYSVKLFYLEMPLLFQYHCRKVIFEGGPCAGIRTYQYEVLARTYPVDLSPYYPFKPAELSLNMGVRYVFNSRWQADLRLSHSVFPVREAIPAISDRAYNRVIGFSVSRRLGRQKTLENKT